MASGEIVAELPTVRVRVNPLNAELTPKDPRYVEAYSLKLAELKAAYLEQIEIAVTAGEIALPPHDDAESEKLHLAHDSAARDLTLAATLAGHGIAGSGNLTYHGVDITYILDDEVPVGGYIIECEEDPGHIVEQLRALS